MTDIRELFSVALDVGREVLACGEVATAWDESSALDQFAVSGLAGHLVRAVTSVTAYLDRPPPALGEALLDPAGYMASIDGLSDDLSIALHQAIRNRGDTEAADGHAALVRRWDEQVWLLRTRLASESRERTLAALEGRAMLLDDYLVTRMMELVIHSDDLAVSVGVATPPFAPAAWQVVIDCLVGTATRRHGERAVLMALSRRERDPIQALRVL